MIVAEFDGDMSAKCRAAEPYIDGDVQNAAAHYAYQLALRLRILQVQAAKHAFRRPRQIVLNERSGGANLTISFGVKMFEEESPLISKYLRFDRKDIGQIGIYDLHRLVPVFHESARTMHLWVA
jgi:hypothetical protein